jgi:hypothetical protein
MEEGAALVQPAPVGNDGFEMNRQQPRPIAQSNEAATSVMMQIPRDRFSSSGHGSDSLERRQSPGAIGFTPCSGTKGLNLSRFSQHLVDLIQMQLFADDHLSRKLFEQHGLAFSQFQ